MMLGIPETAFADPETGRRPDELQVADWIEGSITFMDDSISQNDVVDQLHENYLTDKTDAQSVKDSAAACVEAVWQELKRRASCLGAAASYRVESHRIEREKKWELTPGFSFCLLVALFPAYRKIFEGLTDYNKQGEIFEHLTAASLAALGWQVHRAGWSRTTADTIKAKIEAVANFLGAGSLEGATERWTAPKAKDTGLDIICQYVFRDGWGGKPIIMMQCASGDNWEDKLHAPELEQWKKLVDFPTGPVRGLSMPFIIQQDRFRRAGIKAGFVMLLDRHRLAVPDKLPKDWIPSALRKEIVGWMKDRVKALCVNAA